MTMDHLRRYFLRANGSQGLVSYEASHLGALRRVVRLNAYPAPLMEELAGSLAETAAACGLEAETPCCFLDGSPEGVILPGISAAVMNQPAYLPESHAAFSLLDGEIPAVRQALREAQRCFREAKGIHDAWEKVYIANTDFAGVRRFAAEKSRALIPGEPAQPKGACVHRFFGAATADGSVDHIAELTAGLPNRYFLKGRPGTGKSTLLRLIAAYALDRGYDVELYHCSFDPDSADMVVLRSLGFCVFDSTPPHEYFPVLPGDEIWDLYALAVKPGTDEFYAAELAAFQAAYREKTAQAAEFLRAAKDRYGAFCAGFLRDLSPGLWQEEKARILRELLGPAA